MADSFLALTDLTKINDANIADIDVSDLLNKAILLQNLSAVTASNGDVHKYVKETGAPTVGYRAIDAGREMSKSADTVVTINLKVLDASFRIDTALARAYKRGPDAYIAREAARHLREAFYHFETQIWYGSTDGDTGGFDGLIDDALLADLDTGVVIDAGGTAARTSIWLVKTGEENMSAVLGREGNIEIDPTVIQQVQDGSSKHYGAYYTNVNAWTGIQIGSKWSVLRIANVGDTVGTVTDDLIYSALELAPGPFDYVVMNRRSINQLRNSRTATNATGSPAPMPTDLEGIPILTVESLNNGETEVTA